MKQLTLEDRYQLGMYSRKLPSTLMLRLVINDFLSQIEFTSDEIKNYEIKIDEKSLKFSCNDSSYVTEYSEFPPVVVDAMSKYIVMLDNDRNAGNELLQRTVKVFKKVI